MLPDSRVKKTVAPRVPTLKKPSVLAEMRMGAVEPEGSYDTIRIEGQHAADAISDWTLTTFLDCSLENLTFETVLFDHAAITSTRFAGLRGTTMLVDQISQLAQSFAASLGIRLEEPEG